VQQGTKSHIPERFLLMAVFLSVPCKPSQVLLGSWTSANQALCTWVTA